MLAYNIFIVFLVYDVASLDLIVTNKVSNFEGAHQICSSLGTEIVRVDMLQDSHDILAEVREKYRYIESYWVDVNDIKEEGLYVHYDGTLAVGSRWYPGYPDRSTIKNCAYNGISFFLNVRNCDDKLHVICAKVPKQEFFITNLISDFERAHKICSSLGTEIVRVDNIDTAKDIHAEIKKKYPDDTGYWVDANDKKNENVWVHYDGTPAANNMWLPEDPNYSRLGNCVTGSWRMKWVDYFCSKKLRVICSRIPNQDFIITDINTNYEGAVKICSELGLEIVRVENTHIAINIFDKLQNIYPFDGYWVEANDIKTKGTFVHNDGTLAVTNMWDIGQPKEGTNMNCAWVKSFGLWRSENCSYGHRVICSLPKK